MGFRFRKRIKIAPGIHLNFSKSGISTSIGKPGATINIGKKGVRTTVGIPGTGLSYSKNVTRKTKNQNLSQELTQNDSILGKFFWIIVVFFFAAAVMDTSSNESYSVVEVKSLRVRSQPSTHAKVINHLILGDEVKVKQNEKGWSLIESDNDISGWVASKYLSDAKQE